MTKPFRFDELLARVRLRLRQADADRRQRRLRRHPRGRRGRASTSAPARPPSTARQVDLSAAGVHAGRDLHANPGQVLSREQLLDHVWGYDFDPGSNVVDVYVGYLRKKFGAGTIRPSAGVGYRFNG